MLSPLATAPGMLLMSGNDCVTVEIVILAMIAAFLGLRLYAVLGKRAEHGDEPLQSRFDPGPTASAVAQQPRTPVNHAPVAPARTPASVPPLVERGLRNIAVADRRFDPVAFIEGASAAYRMILEAYWRGDAEELAGLCDTAVAQSFAEAIAARAAAGEVLDNRLVRITEAEITQAVYAAPHARVTVRFVADIAAVTRDAAGKAIAGSLTDAVEVRDVWTFARDVTSATPDWLLEETDAD